MSSSGDCSFAIARQPRGVVVTVRGRLDLADATRLGAVLADLIEGQGNATLGVDLGGLTGVAPRGSASSRWPPSWPSTMAASSP